MAQAVRSWRRKLLNAVLLVATVAPSCAQQAPGSLAGHITDLYNHPLEGVSITLRNRSTGQQWHTTSQRGGLYRFQQLPPGLYLLTAVQNQRGTGQLDEILINPGQAQEMQTALAFTAQPPAPVQLAAAPQQIHPPDPATAMHPSPVSPVGAPAVVAAASGMALVQLPLQTTSQDFPVIEEPVPTPAPEPAAEPPSPDLLPVCGRQWQTLFLDDAGSVESSADPVARLGPPLVLDGLSRALVWKGPFSTDVPMQSELPPDDAMAAAALHSAEVGTHHPDTDAAAPSAIILTSEHGGDALHGKLYLFDRQAAWAAHNPFSTWVRQTAAATANTTPTFTAEPYTPADYESLAGLGLGGPLNRHSASWFLSADHLQQHDPALSSVRHPTQFFAQPSTAEATELAAALNRSSTNLPGEGLAAYSSMLTTLAGLLGPAARTVEQWTAFGRLDWAPRERAQLTATLSSSYRNSPGGAQMRSTVFSGTNSLGNQRSNDEWAGINSSYYLTENLRASVATAFHRVDHRLPAGSPSAYEQTFLPVNGWNQLPQIVVDTSYGFQLGNPAGNGSGPDPAERMFELRPQLAYARGRILLHAGLLLRHSEDELGLLANQTGTYRYTTVDNFIRDALAYASFGVSGQLNRNDQHNCDQTGRVWTDTSGVLHGIGYLPCYASYTQRIGPTGWWLAANDWASYLSAQWQPAPYLTLTAGARWELEKMPPPIARLANPDLPAAGRLPFTGNQWAPRFSLALGSQERRWPVLHLGAGWFYGRTPNRTLMNLLTRTGSPSGDLDYFLQPTDNLNGGGAPAFPYVLQGAPGNVVRPGAVEVASGFRNPSVGQADIGIEAHLPARFHLAIDVVASLARCLPVTFDTNIDPVHNPSSLRWRVVDATGLGPLKPGTYTYPFYANWPAASGTAGRANSNYQQIVQLESRANATYEAAELHLSRSARLLSLDLRYTFAHAGDWNPDETAQIFAPSVFNPADFAAERGPGNLDQRQRASAWLVLRPPSPSAGLGSWLAGGWMLSAVGVDRSGLPYTMRTSGSIPRTFTSGGAVIAGLSEGMLGYGGQPRVWGVGRNTYRYPWIWKADMRIAKQFDLGHLRSIQLLAESFNLFNHQNLTRLETVGYRIQSATPADPLPSLNFLTGLTANSTAFGKPLDVNASNSYRERQLQVGIQLRF